jgi:hypothetical protein
MPGVVSPIGVSRERRTSLARRRDLFFDSAQADAPSVRLHALKVTNALMPIALRISCSRARWPLLIWSFMKDPGGSFHTS